MRDFLEDADKHRDDGYGRAQHHVKQQLPKRFYKDVGVGTVGDGFAVTLDGRSPRPARRARPDNQHTNWFVRHRAGYYTGRDQRATGGAF